MSVGHHVVCSHLACDWEWYLPVVSEESVSECWASFRQHCIERHGLERENLQTYVHLNLVNCTLTLIKANRDDTADTNRRRIRNIASAAE